MNHGLEHYWQEASRLAIPRMLAAAGIHITAITEHARPWPTVVALVAVLAAHFALGVWFGRNARTPGAWAAVARAAGHLVPELLCAVLAGWPPTVIFFILFNALAHNEADGRRARYTVFASIVLIGSGALLNGVDPLTILGLSVISTLSFFATERRTKLTRRLLDDLAERNKELLEAQKRLELLHEKALVQEKLSSLGLLAAGIAHEINNPMSFVKANVNALLEDLTTRRATLDPALVEYVEDVLPATLDGIERVNSIVKDMRLFARGDAESMTAYDLNEQVEIALRIVRSNIPHNCDVTVDLAPVAQATGFPRQIVQVVINLLMNAAEAHAPDQQGVVHVSTRQEREHLVIAIRDRGSGLSPETRARLFEPFFTTKAVGKGTGLGLSVAFGIVTSHRGRIGVESAPGSGSVFTVWLPIEPGLNLLAAAVRA